MLHFVTVATREHPMLELLQSTLAKKKYTLDILGLEMNKKIGWEAHGNLGLKLKLFCEYIHLPKLEKDDIVIYLDAYDVIFAGTKDILLERFQKFQTPIVFGAETSCFPNELENRYPLSTSGFPFRYLNSGLCIGKVWALRECFIDYIYEDSINDQYWWKLKFLERPDLIDLDYTNTLFLNCNGVDKNSIQLENDIISYNKKHPQVLHFNGTSKAIMNRYAKLDPNPYYLFSGATKESYILYGGE